MPTPVYSRPEAYDLLVAQLPILETTAGLVTGAVAVARQEFPLADPQAVQTRLEDYAARVRERVRGNNPEALLAHLHAVLFDEEGFVGNTDDYYNPANSYLPLVLESKRGIPITLALLYKGVGELLGLQVCGVNAPGHFLVGVDINGSRMLIDPFFSGRLLTPEEAMERIERTSGQVQGRAEDVLQTATHRQWLGRLIQNLLAIFIRNQQHDLLAAMHELRLQLAD